MNDAFRDHYGFVDRPLDEQLEQIRHAMDRPDFDPALWWHVYDGEQPALFLTARDSVEDRVAGFEAGGDDYLVKPFSMDELVVRVRALCRRAGTSSPAIVQIGDLEVDQARARVRRAEVLLSLTAKELCVLQVLAINVGNVVSRTELIEHCWDELTDPMSNTVDVHIASVRRKLGDPLMIETVRGLGYRLDEPGAIF